MKLRFLVRIVSFFLYWKLKKKKIDISHSVHVPEIAINVKVQENGLCAYLFPRRTLIPQQMAKQFAALL